MIPSQLRSSQTNVECDVLDALSRRRDRARPIMGYGLACDSSVSLAVMHSQLAACDGLD
jgi:hypothetical protein